ncbi:PaaI family thioesterase [Aquabacterium humicola]|uniref:PaaI family thioesterase n=1 Tax=Aquabacterium humicola TaxID=3237377 RepID=UPI002543DDF5|nr:PaaI family thioesterase [Rubrivivax pictus]
MSSPTPEETLAAWQAREAELRARMHAPGVSRPEQFAGRTGTQIFEAMFSGELPTAPIAHTLDYLLIEARHGHAEFQGRPQFAHYNPLGTVHGGWIATLLDSAVACAVHSTLAPGKAYTTLELKVNYVKALTERVPLVRAIGDVISVGNRVGTAEGRLVGPDGTLYAHATTTCLIFEMNGGGNGR